MRAFVLKIDLVFFLPFTQFRRDPVREKAALDKFRRMDLRQIKSDIIVYFRSAECDLWNRIIPISDRKRLVGFILDLNRSPEEIADRRRRLAEAIDDKSPERWLTLEQFKDRVEKLAAERGEE